MNQEILTIKTQYAATLHDIGDQIERIAEQLKNVGDETDYKKLYRLGNEIEHFFDQFEDSSNDGSGSTSYKSAQSADGLNANGGKNQLTGLSENHSSSVINPTQESQ